MNFLKIIVALAVLFLAVIGAFAVFGLVAFVVKYLLVIAALALVGFVAYKALAGPARPQLEANRVELELEKAERALAEIRRKQLTK